MIVCFGSINIDLIFPLPVLPLVGQTVLGPTMRMEPGGKGANQAVAAARDGATVVFAGAVGRDGFAEDAVELMRASGVDISRIIRAKGEATGCAAICVDPQGRNLIAVASGANLSARHTQVEDALLDARTTLLLQGEVTGAETEALIERGRAAGCRIVLNLAPVAAFSRAALQAVDVLVVNEDEGAWLAQHLGVDGLEGVHRALGVDVVRTIGDQGVEAVTTAGVFRVGGRAVAVVDTTGAGDCFTGVLAAALDRGQPLASALARANAAAGLACTRAGTQGSMPLAADVDRALG